MNIVIKPKALRTIDAIADFVESKNTPGSGDRYVLKFQAAIKKMALPGVEYAICNHHVLVAFRYSCRNFNDWVIVFKIANNEFTVYEIIHGSLLY